MSMPFAVCFVLYVLLFYLNLCDCDKCVMIINYVVAHVYLSKLLFKGLFLFRILICFFFGFKNVFILLYLSKNKT